MTIAADTEQVRTFAQAEERLAVTLPGYESRPQQQRLAQAIEQALDTRHNLLAQAGCGTGKSLGAMIPALLHAVSTGQRVVVSTATIALMNQYAEKDIPFLQENLGVPFRWALLKGRSNYLCMAKATAANPAEVPVVAELLKEIEDNEEHDGDKDHFTARFERSDWSKVSATGDECPGRSRCPFGDVCFAEFAKARAQGANLVVTNHAMTFTDIKVRELTDGFANMLGNYDVMILDEGHEIEEIATKSLTDTLRTTGMTKLVSECRNFAADNREDDWRVLGNDVIETAARVWDLLPKPDAKTGHGPMPLRFFLEQEEPFTELIAALFALARRVSDINVISREMEGKRARLATRATNYANRITEIILAPDTELVRWTETDDRDNLIFNSSPIEVGPWLTTNLWDKATSVVLSATLATGNGDFSFIQQRLGLEGAVTVDAGTPFDYSTQALLYVPPSNIPDPKKNRSAWLSMACTLTLELISAAKGGALILCTSNESLRNMYDTLGEQLRDKGLTVLRQGAPGWTNKELAKTFQEDTHSVLFATRSFFTGVDFAGDTCRLVVIDKLPFASPFDVMAQARGALLDRKAGRSVAFGKLVIPSMILTLLQGFGRLIRTKNDRGVVAILDSRLSSTGYGKQILAAMPDCPATTDLARVRAYYEAA